MNSITPGLTTEKFEQRAPAPQNAIDIFRDHWASDLSKVVPGVTSGSAQCFRDARPAAAFKHIGGDCVARGARILELGPLEGGHTYQFEQFGAAEIIAVEANVEAYLKCLIVKELLGLRRARFLLGDFAEYLRQDQGRYDLIFCSGVLYHMPDPVELIRLMAARTDLISVWTHYHTPESWPSTVPEAVNYDGETYVYHRRVYAADHDCGTFWGGNKSTACLLSRDDLMRAFRHYGFVHHDVDAESLDHPYGPCLTVTFRR
jgi:hypothetical protein